MTTVKITMTPIKPRKKLLEYSRFETEIRDETQDIRDEIKDEFKDVVSDWEHQPSFEARTIVGADRIKIEIRATGPNAKIWRYVDEGTRAHLIRPKRARRLRFQTGYSARTRPGKAHVGTGKATGDIVYADVVYHPGTEAREFTVTILNTYQPLFKEAVDRAIREANR